MRLVSIAAATCLLVVGCASSSTQDASVAPTPTANSETVAPNTTSSMADTATGIPPLLADHEIKDVQVGDRVVRLAIADSPGLRATGLMGVTDLGDLDGMLFYWRHHADGGFWMKDTLIPLDIVWFDIEGIPVGRASMIPCESDPCPTYSPEVDVDYRYAIEANPGTLDWVTDETVLTYED